MPGPYTQSAAPGSVLQPQQNAITSDAAVVGRQLLTALMRFLGKRSLQYSFGGVKVPIAELLYSEALCQHSVRGCDQYYHMQCA